MATQPADQSTQASSGYTPGSFGPRLIVQLVFFALVVRPLMALFIGLRVQGRENLRQPGPFVLVANHSSHLDTVSLLSLFPLGRLRYVRPVAAADYFERNRFVSVLSRTLFNILPIARKNITTDNNPLRRMKAALDRGESLIIFPEGTRGSGDEVGQFRSGVAHLLEKTPNLPVIPAYLLNMGRSLPKGEFIPVPFFCEVRIGTARLIGGSRAEITSQLEAAVRGLSEQAPTSR
jgi:1-acyl-sn-glycerol-3-phosphate acyltransferase